MKVDAGKRWKGKEWRVQLRVPASRLIVMSHQQYHVLPTLQVPLPSLSQLEEECGLDKIFCSLDFGRWKVSRGIIPGSV